MNFFFINFFFYSPANRSRVEEKRENKCNSACLTFVNRLVVLIVRVRLLVSVNVLFLQGGRWRWRWRRGRCHCSLHSRGQKGSRPSTGDKQSGWDIRSFRAPGIWLLLYFQLQLFIKVLRALWRLRSELVSRAACWAYATAVHDLRVIYKHHPESLQYLSWL